MQASDRLKPGAKVLSETTSRGQEGRKRSLIEPVSNSFNFRSHRRTSLPKA